MLAAEALGALAQQQQQIQMHLRQAQAHAATLPALPPPPPPPPLSPTFLSSARSPIGAESMSPRHGGPSEAGSAGGSGSLHDHETLARAMQRLLAASANSSPSPSTPSSRMNSGLAQGGPHVGYMAQLMDRVGAAAAAAASAGGQGPALGASGQLGLSPGGAVPVSPTGRASMSASLEGSIATSALPRPALASSPHDTPQGPLSPEGRSSAERAGASTGAVGGEEGRAEGRRGLNEPTATQLLEAGLSGSSSPLRGAQGEPSSASAAGGLS
jgi:hypothetical protein